MNGKNLAIVTLAHVGTTLTASILFAAHANTAGTVFAVGAVGLGIATIVIAIGVLV